MNFQQVRHPIDYVIQRVRTGRLALPEFQRDFVWSPSQVVELLDSIARQWPIGSLLLLSGPQPFAFKPIDSAPKIHGGELELYVLDGQQRITALYHAIADVSRYCYYIDFSALEEGDDDFIRWSLRTKMESQYPNLKARAKAKIALIKDIWEQPDFFTWMQAIDEKDRSKFLLLREHKLAGLQSKIYQMMAIELDKGVELEALARIFETINRTGIALDAFDLLVAKLYPTGFNLREEWNKAKEESIEISEFSPNELEVLKLISLLVRRKNGKVFARGVRQGDLLSIEPEYIIQHWREAVELYARALKECHRFGVTRQTFVPSWSMILGVAGCLLFAPDKIDTWWRNTLWSQIFAQGANTKIVAEFDSNMGKSIALSGAMSISSAEDMLLLSAKSNGLFNRGFMALVKAHGAMDPITGKLLEQCENIAFRTLTKSGEIRKLEADDTIGSVIMTSIDMKSKRFTAINISNFEFSKPALISQGIDLESMRRTSTFLLDVFQKENN